MKKVRYSIAYSFVLVILLAVACNGQPKSDYDISSTPVVGATTYHFFLEKKSATAYHLIQGMDYLSPSVIGYKIGQSSVPTFTVNLANDSSQYTVGIVAEDPAGFYGGMGVNIGVVGKVPSIPSNVKLIKK